jgi:hypothetical protein
LATTELPLMAERIASLARALLELPQAGDAAGADALCGEMLAGLSSKRRAELLREVEPLLSSEGPVVTEPAGGSEAAPAGGARELLRERASLELKLKTEAARYAELEVALQRERDGHAEALQSLALQQKQISELQQARRTLEEQLGQSETRLRRQINETEQVQLKLDELKKLRRTVGTQVTEQAEQVNALRAENEELRRKYEALLRAEDQRADQAERVAAGAQQQTATADYEHLWSRMHAQLPTVILETHQPNRATFERLTDALVEMVRVLAALEQHVHFMLKSLGGEKLSRFHNMLSRSPGLADTFRDYLTGRGSANNFLGLLRAVQAWSRAFGSGCYKVIVRSPDLIQDELNYRRWPLKKGSFETEEAALGRYFRDTVFREASGRLGTAFRKHAGDEAHDDYATLMKPE